jgi:hypothetical protein
VFLGIQDFVPKKSHKQKATTIRAINQIIVVIEIQITMLFHHSKLDMDFYFYRDKCIHAIFDAKENPQEEGDIGLL